MKKRRPTTTWNGRDVTRGRWVEPTAEERRVLDAERRARRAAEYAGAIEMSDASEKTPVLSGDADDVLEDELLLARVAVSRTIPFSRVTPTTLVVGAAAVGVGYLIGSWWMKRNKPVAPRLPTMTLLPAWAVT